MIDTDISQEAVERLANVGFGYDLKPEDREMLRALSARLAEVEATLQSEREAIWTVENSDWKRRADLSDALIKAALEVLAQHADCHDDYSLAMDMANDPGERHMTKPKVKPLVWESPSADNNHIYVARSIFGDYGIHICGGRHRAWLEAHVKPYENWLGDGDVGSVYEAQSQAQADYERRILEALE